MFIEELESEVQRHARAMGCARPEPAVGLCVDCPMSRGCRVPRVPVAVWATRITVDLGHADATFYLNDLACSRVAARPRMLPRTRLVTWREDAIEVACGDVVLDEDDPLADGSFATINLPQWLERADAPPCGRPIPMAARQLRYNQVSNYGRKGIFCVQACSRECAEATAAAVNRRWHVVLRMIREIRRLREVPVNDAAPASPSEPAPS